MAVQNALKAEGSFIYPTVTGFYGEYTKSAVKNFQLKNQLKATGVLDEPTLTKLKQVRPELAPTLTTATTEN